jgi:hypothetical protein
MSAIIGFHQDAEQQWVAELECGHTQHVRHTPPWQVRPWVLTAAGRASHVGTDLRCPCEQAEPRNGSEAHEPQGHQDRNSHGH